MTAAMKGGCVWPGVAACLFVMASTAMAQERLPDLIPVVINANQGSVEIQNIGHTVAKPSRVFVVCSVRDSGKTKPCAEGLHLPGFIKKWNTLPFDIPALKPGAIHRIRVFGAGAFPHTPGLHGMNIIVDPLKKVAESNESNNSTRLEIAFKEKEPSLSKALDKIPDLVPLIANADQGIVRIQNNGTAPAPASTLVASCKVYDSRGTLMHACTARTYLPNFDANRLLLNYDIPALKPGQSHEIHLFGSDAWPDRPGRYHLEVVADFDKQVAEISEANNSTSFTSLHAANDSKKGTTERSPHPDLVPVASDPFFGIVYVENDGDSTAGASKLLMTCKQSKQSGECPTSSAMEDLYDGKLGGFVKDLPPIPAGQVKRVVFPMSGLVWEKGIYTFSVTADAGRAVAESSEDNNTAIKTVHWDTGTLRLVAVRNGKNVPVIYHIDPAGERAHVRFLWPNRSGRNVQTPMDIPLPAGTYQLGVRSVGVQSVEQRFKVEIKAGKVLAKHVVLLEPGLLRFDVLDDHNKVLSRVSYSVNASGKRNLVASMGGGTGAFKLRLSPGIYDLHIYHNLSERSTSGASTKGAAPVMGKREEQVIRGIKIESGRTIEKTAHFKHIEPGELKVHVLAGGKPNRAYINVSPVAKGSPVLFSFDSSARVKIVPGSYRLTIRPKDEKDSATFQNAGYGVKNVEITIHAGETLEKRVNFVTKARKGSLVLTVMVNGRRGKAGIGIRKVGIHGPFYTVDAGKTEFLPGHYDFKVWPVGHCLSPGGVDVFHGGVSGPRLRARMLPGVKPVILHNIEIKAGEVTKKTVEFKGITRYSKVCM